MLITKKEKYILYIVIIIAICTYIKIAIYDWEDMINMNKEYFIDKLCKKKT